MRALISKVFERLATEEGKPQEVALTDDLVLLDNGFDSLFFALLVVELEAELGWDPFVAEDLAYYPRTFGEFVAFYQEHQIKHSNG